MLICKNQDLDLGTLKFGVTHSFNFKLKNQSVNTATIDKLILGCYACTQATVDKSIVAFNEEVVVKAEFTPGSTGINNKYIILHYNGVNMIKLKFKANVIK